MSDRFKFRVWYKLLNKYVEKENSLCLMYDGVLFEYDSIAIESDNYVIEQCTGLKDKNGNLIYEGDYIKSPNNSHPLEIVRMPNGVYGCRVCKTNGVWEMNLYDLIRNYGVEIIGNIHETKGGKDE